MATNHEPQAPANGQPDYNEPHPLRAAVKWILGIVLIGGLSWLMVWNRPELRHYPNRQPVIFWHTWTGEWKTRAIDPIIDAFNKSQTRYEVIGVSVPQGDLEQKFILAAVGGHPPDCLALGGQLLPKFAQRKLIKPLDATVMTPQEFALYRQEAYPIVLKAASYEGHLYGIATNMNTAACYYQPAVIRAAGLDPDHFPKTLEELTAWGKKLNKYDANGNLVRIGFLPEYIQRIAPSFGARYWDPKTQRVTLDTPQMLRALTYMRDCYKSLGFGNVVRFRAGLKSGVNADQWPFISGQYAIALDGQWRMDDLRKYAPHLKFRTAPFPPPIGGKKDGVFDGTNRMVIPTEAANSEGAWQFIKFWSGLDGNTEQAAKFFVAGAWLPTTTAIANSATYRAFVQKNPQYQTFVDLLHEDMEPLPPTPIQPLVEEELENVEDYIVRGKKTPEQALKDAQAEIDHELDRQKKLGL